MFNYRWVFLGFLSICLFGCLENKFDDKAQKGPMSRKELQTERGTAQSIQQTPTNQEIHKYPNDESFQVEGDEVTYYYRKPTAPEESLQYWLNRWGNDVYHFTSVEEGNHLTDILPNLYYVNYDNNERFIYDRSIQKVVRVIYELDTEHLGAEHLDAGDKE